MNCNILYYAKHVLTALLFLMGAISTYAQIDFRIGLATDGKTYTVYDQA